MLYQVTAYTVLDHLALQLTRAETQPEGYAWTHMLLEQVELPHWVRADPWDVVWLMATRLADEALKRGNAASRA